METIRPSDLAAIHAPTSLSIRGQTKLDKRPRVLYVTGLNTYDVEDFRQALAVRIYCLWLLFRRILLSVLLLLLLYPDELPVH